jgi:hypothetical protein
MFLVTDDLITREDKIRGFIKREPAIAVLLAAADCERTIRRAILALGVTPTLELQHRLGRPRPVGWRAPTPRPKKYASSIKGYNEAWSDELGHLKQPLLDGVAGSERTLRVAFQLRHDLIHGDKGTTGIGYARKQVERLLEATAKVTAFAEEHGVDLHMRLKRRIKARG